MTGYWPSLASVFLLASAALAADPLPQLLLPPGLAESQLRNINQMGDAVGHCEIYDAAGDSIADFACSFSKGSVTPIPKLKRYTKMDCMAISDSGIVVGHAYAPQHAEDSVLQAIVFDPRNSSTEALPNLPASNATLATAISGDGETIAGICSGRACIWDRQANSWTVSALPQRIEGLATRHVCLSDDGKIAVAFQRANQNVQLAQWNRDERGIWHCVVRLETEVSPHDVNNAAVIVGSKRVHAARHPETRGFVLSPNREIELIEPFDGDNYSTARSVNNGGVVVGWSDGVGDHSKWPRSFVWKGSILQALEMEPLTTPNQAYGINDQSEVVGLLERENDPHAVGFVSKVSACLPLVTQSRLTATGRRSRLRRRYGCISGCSESGIVRPSYRH